MTTTARTRSSTLTQRLQSRSWVCRQSGRHSRSVLPNKELSIRGITEMVCSLLSLAGRDHKTQRDDSSAFFPIHSSVFFTCFGCGSVNWVDHHRDVLVKNGPNAMVLCLRKCVIVMVFYLLVHKISRRWLTFKSCIQLDSVKNHMCYSYLSWIVHLTMDEKHCGTSSCRNLCKRRAQSGSSIFCKKICPRGNLSRSRASGINGSYTQLSSFQHEE